MKIAILTLPLHHNFGGILQAYALQTALEKLGHNVEVLQKSATLNRKWCKSFLIYSKRVVQKILLGKDQEIFLERNSRKNNIIIETNTRQFINKHINLRTIDRLSDLDPKDYDAIVVGSDQIWRPKYVRYLWRSGIEDAFLIFAQNWSIKRIAYAPSFGVDSWEYTATETKECKALIKRFEAISVRENSGTELCKKYLDVTARALLDPTMLLQKGDYLKLISNFIHPSNPYLFTYILDPNPVIEENIKLIASEHKLDLKKGNVDVENKRIPLKDRIQPAVEEWLSGIANAELILTDSFHACVFAIIFQKPFFVIGNKDRGLSRFNSLLKQFNLEDHLISDFQELLTHKPLPDQETVQSKLDELRVESLKFLQDSLQ